MIASNAAESWASFWFSNAIFSLNFRGFAMMARGTSFSRTLAEPGAPTTTTTTNTTAAAAAANHHHHRYPLSNSTDHHPRRRSRSLLRFLPFSFSFTRSSVPRRALPFAETRTDCNRRFVNPRKIRCVCLLDGTGEH